MKQKHAVDWATTKLLLATYGEKWWNENFGTSFSCYEEAIIYYKIVDDFLMKKEEKDNENNV